EENAFQKSELTFYGSSFITDGTGDLIESASKTEETVLVHEFDLDELRDFRLSWGVFRDRRPEMYKQITE
ncbi:MAG: N-carbamoylputrescine amidase, partial [Oscillospiraceae bacterium]